ncbi:metalloprotease TIKI1-like [Anneissia japonica]|uniref:metalloprotease TIKI1-like n=1 Tax=Anneissia japonica TaxID=1529436 RepID=UPI0014258C97|nr:metalloprotease TIKI1-like [Anneissia japonica]
MNWHHFLRIFMVIYMCLIPFAATYSVSKLRKGMGCANDKESSKTNSFLWRVRREPGPPAYFFGTIHVPYTRVWDYIPSNTKRAFRDSKNIFFELDLTDSKTINDLTYCQMLPQGEKLQDVLPESIYLRLKSHLEYVRLMMPSWMTQDQRGKGLYADYLFNAIAGNWEQKRPVWVMLLVNSLTEADVKSKGIPVLDLYLAQEANRSNKGTGAVEKVEEQCVPLNGLNFSQVLFALNQTLFQHESLRSGESHMSYTTEDLIRHYNCGDLDSVIFNRDTAQLARMLNTTLTSVEYTTANEIDEYFKEELIIKRNRRMAKRVKELLEEYPKKSFFFAFGAGHFLGNHTVIDLLKSEGYTVEHVPADEEIKRRRKTNEGEDNMATGSPQKRHRKRRRKKVFTINPPIARKETQPQSNVNNFNELWVKLPKGSASTPPKGEIQAAKEHGAMLTTVASPLLAYSNIYVTYVPTTSGSACSFTTDNFIISLLLILLVLHSYIL